MKKGMTAIDILIYILIGIAVVAVLYFAIIQPIYDTGSSVAGKLG